MNLKINIPKDANQIIQTLQKYGYQAYVVGGCVRDSILGRIPHDWDICTSASPEQIYEVFQNDTVLPTGLQHGTVTILLNHEPYEVTTYRIDGTYSDCRKPDYVTFTTDLIEDLKRRDFTINAMAYNEKDGLIDPFHGIEDIQNKKIKCVGSAKDRFGEDALRILRAIRFASQLNFQIEQNTALEIHQQYSNLSNISMERIQNEFYKMISSDYFPDYLSTYQDVFSFFIPELKHMIQFPQNNPYHIYDVFEHTIQALKHCSSKDPIVKLSILFHDIGKPYSYYDDENDVRHFKGHGKISAELTDTILKRLKFDNETKNKIVELVKYHDTVFDVHKQSIKRWLNKIGEEQLRRLLEVRKADILGQNPIYSFERLKKVDNIEILIDEIIQEKECFQLKDLAVNGNDLIKIGYQPNKELGDTLHILLQKVIDGEYSNEKDYLLEEAENLLEFDDYDDL